MTTTSKTLDKFISPLIAAQIPSIYQEEGPMFIEFVKAYYEWLEQEQNVVGEARLLQQFRDLDTTPVDRFIESFKAKYLAGIPRESQADPKLLLKHVKELYSSKGTEQGLKLLFRILFNETAELYYPADDVFKLSDAKFKKPEWVDISETRYNSLLIGERVWAYRYKTLATITLKDSSIIKPVGAANNADDNLKYLTIGDRVEQTYSYKVGGTIIPAPTDTYVALGTIVSIPSSDTIIVDVLTGKFIDQSQSVNGEEVQIKKNVYVIEDASDDASKQTYVKLASPLTSPVRKVNQQLTKMPEPVEAIVDSYETFMHEGRTINALYLSNLRGRFEAGMTLLSDVISSENSPVVRGSLSEVIDLGSGFDYRVGDVMLATGQGGFGAKVVITKVSTRDGTVQMTVVDGGSGYTVENTVLEIQNARTGVGAEFKIATNGLSRKESITTVIDRLYTQMLPEVTTANSANYALSLDPANWRTIDQFWDTNANILRTPIENLTIDDAANVFTFEMGTIDKLRTVSRGEGYTGQLAVNAFDYIVAGHNIPDGRNLPETLLTFNTDIANQDGQPEILESKFKVGDKLIGSASGTTAFVSRYNNASSCYVSGIQVGSSAKLWNETSFYTNETISKLELSNGRELPSQTVNSLLIFIKDKGIKGDNATLRAKAVTGEGVPDEVKVISTGFGYQALSEKDAAIGQLLLTVEDETRRAEVSDGGTIDGTGIIKYNGFGEGDWQTQSGFLSEGKYIHDGDFYQEYSYEVRSKLAFEKYASALKSIWHPVGTGIFGSPSIVDVAESSLENGDTDYVELDVEVENELDLPLVGEMVVAQFDVGYEPVGEGIVLET